MKHMRDPFRCQRCKIMRINWFGLVAGSVTLLTVVISLVMPWWQLTVGEGLLEVNASPVNTNFGLFGSPFRIPLLTALNIISLLTLLASAITMLIYAFNPTTSWSKTLLGFAYKKPLYVLTSFLLGLIIITSVAGYYGVKIPIFGSSTLNFPANFTDGVSISATVAANFLLPFYLTIIAAIFCLVTRIYHRS